MVFLYSPNPLFLDFVSQQQHHWQLNFELARMEYTKGRLEDNSVPLRCKRGDPDLS